MKKLFVIILGLMTVFYTFAQSETEKSEPIVEFQKTIHDFGELEENKSATFNFVFCNFGNSHFVIKKIESSCKCITTKFPKGKITPGETSIITSTLTTSGDMKKDFSQTLNVITDIPEGEKTKTITLTIKGTVKKSQ